MRTPYNLQFDYQSKEFTEPFSVDVHIEAAMFETHDSAGYPAEVIIDNILLQPKGTDESIDIIDYISTELAESIAEYALEIAAERSS